MEPFMKVGTLIRYAGKCDGRVGIVTKLASPAYVYVLWSRPVSISGQRKTLEYFANLEKVNGGR